MGWADPNIWAGLGPKSWYVPDLVWPVRYKAGPDSVWPKKNDAGPGSTWPSYVSTGGELIPPSLHAECSFCMQGKQIKKLTKGGRRGDLAWRRRCCGGSAVAWLPGRRCGSFSLRCSVLSLSSASSLSLLPSVFFSSLPPFGFLLYL